MKELIERLQTLCELSPQTKQSLLDKRKQNALDAIEKWKKADDMVGEIDEIELVKQGKYNCRENEKRLAAIVVPNLDKFSDEELIAVFENAHRMGDSQSLFPSYWNDDTYGDYPARLAKALCESNESEIITDVANIYYQRRYHCEGEAEEVFKQELIKNLKSEVYKTLDVYTNCEELIVNLLDSLAAVDETITAKALDMIRQVDKKAYDIILQNIDEDKFDALDNVVKSYF